MHEIAEAAAAHAARPGDIPRSSTEPAPDRMEGLKARAAPAGAHGAGSKCQRKPLKRLDSRKEVAPFSVSFPLKIASNTLLFVRQTPELAPKPVKNRFQMRAAFPLRGNAPSALSSFLSPPRSAPAILPPWL